MATDQPESIELVFERLSARAIDRCYSLAGYLLGNAAEAEDATGDAMARAWRARRTLRDGEAFEGWLDRILVNVCMDRLRRKKVVRFVDLEAGEQVQASDPFSSLMAGDELGRAMKVLTPEQRAVVVLRFWSDLPVSEIARRVGCPSGTVKSRLHKAVAALKGQMERDEREGIR